MVSKAKISYILRDVNSRQLGNPAVYGYKFIIFFLLYIYASNHASDQCTKCAVMLRDENIHTIIVVDETFVMVTVTIRVRVSQD